MEEIKLAEAIINTYLADTAVGDLIPAWVIWRKRDEYGCMQDWARQGHFWLAVLFYLYAIA